MKTMARFLHTCDLCPMGALYGLVSKLGLYRVRRDEAPNRPLKDSTASGAFTMADVRTFVAEKLGIVGYVNTEGEMK